MQRKESFGQAFPYDSISYRKLSYIYDDYFTKHDSVLLWYDLFELNFMFHFVLFQKLSQKGNPVIKWNILAEELQ